MANLRPPFPWQFLIRWLIIFAIVAVVSEAGLPVSATEAHRYADGVLFPRFTAAVNDFAYQHPTDTPTRAWEHVQKLDAGDVKRWQLVREAFKETDEAMKRAGY